MTVSRAGALAEEIEAAIAGGEIPSGARIGTKEELLRRYGVAYGTLNEAMRILHQRGYVESRSGPGGGMFATLPNASFKLANLILGFREGGTLADCAVVRNALEEPVIVDAAASRARADVVALETNLRRMEAAASDPAAYLFENWQFHRRIAQICRNRVLGSLYCTLLDANESQVREVAPSKKFAAEVAGNLAAHREIVAAIASGSAERARRAAEKHAAFLIAPPPKSIPLQPAIPRVATRKALKRRRVVAR